MLPVLGGEVVESQQRVAILGCQTRAWNGSQGARFGSAVNAERKDLCTSGAEDRPPKPPVSSRSCASLPESPLDLPAVVNAADVSAAHTKLLQSVADGTLTPEEAQAVSGLLSLQLKMIAGNEPEGSPWAGDGSVPTGPATGLPPPRPIKVMYGEPPKQEVEPNTSEDL
jgi:hypothetical protein